MIIWAEIMPLLPVLAELTELSTGNPPHKFYEDYLKLTEIAARKFH